MLTIFKGFLVFTISHRQIYIVQSPLFFFKSMDLPLSATILKHFDEGCQYMLDNKYYQIGLAYIRPEEVPEGTKLSKLHTQLTGDKTITPVIYYWQQINRHKACQSPPTLTDRLFGLTTHLKQKN